MNYKRTTISNKSILILLFVANTSMVFSQQIITDRPDQTESSSTIYAGSLQIESGISLGFSEENGAKYKEFAGPSTLFRYGVTEKLEIRVFNQYQVTTDLLLETKQKGITDLEVGFKAQLLRKDDINTEIAFLSHAIIPTGSSYFSLNNKYGTINKLSISHEINDKYGIGYNLGYNYFVTGVGDFTYSLVLGVVVNDKVSIYLEPYGDLVEFEEYISNFDAGFTYFLNDDFQLDFSFGTGINNYMNYLSVGFSWNINDHK